MEGHGSLYFGDGAGRKQQFSGGNSHISDYILTKEKRTPEWLPGVYFDPEGI